jgi:phosphoserine aminotransferase
VLPEPVLRRAQEALWDLDGTGIGILEHSHRGDAFERVLARTEAAIRRVGGVSDDHAVLFLQGGASAQFFMVPMNFLGGGTVDVCDSGIWAKKAIAEAKRFGQVHVACAEANATPSWSARPTYVHYTSNETIGGVQWTAPPTPPDGVPLICDASSDIFSRRIDWSRHAMVYAGAQKNLGASGVTLVILRRDLAERGLRDLPPMLQYRTYVTERSMYNTPPTFGIFVIGEVMAWIEAEGGVDAMAARAATRSRLLYDFLDRSSVFEGIAPVESRSRMNVTFRTRDPELGAGFLFDASMAGLDGLAGHRSVGGMRASLYNAFPIAGVEALVTCMADFERQPHTRTHVHA